MNNTVEKKKYPLSEAQKEKNRLYSREYRAKKYEENPSFYVENNAKVAKEKLTEYQRSYKERQKLTADAETTEKVKAMRREHSKRMYEKYKQAYNYVKTLQDASIIA